MRMPRIRPKRLQQLPYPRPLVTNAHYNRGLLITMLEAGLSTHTIAAAFPEVFYVDAGGKIGQRYTAVYSDGITKEVDMMIVQSAVDRLIAETISDVED